MLPSRGERSVWTAAAEKWMGLLLFVIASTCLPLAYSSADTPSRLHQGRLMMRREAGTDEDGQEESQFWSEPLPGGVGSSTGEGGDASFYAPNTLLANLVEETQALEAAGAVSEAAEELRRAERSKSETGSGEAPYSHYCAKEGGICTCKGDVYYGTNVAKVPSEDLSSADFTHKFTETGTTCSAFYFNNYNPRPGVAASCYCEALEYYTYEYGVGSSCESGKEVKTEKECEFAATQLGITSNANQRLEWTSSYRTTSHRRRVSVPKGCNVRDPNAGGTTDLAVVFKSDAALLELKDMNREERKRKVHRRKYGAAASEEDQELKELVERNKEREDEEEEEAPDRDDDDDKDDKEAKKKAKKAAGGGGGGGGGGEEEEEGVAEEDEIEETDELQKSGGELSEGKKSPKKKSHKRWWWHPRRRARRRRFRRRRFRRRRFRRRRTRRRRTRRRRTRRRRTRRRTRRRAGGPWDCDWAPAYNLYSANTVESRAYNLQTAKDKCAANTACKAITCNTAQTSCTLRKSSWLTYSSSAETTFQPTDGCYKQARLIKERHMLVCRVGKQSDGHAAQNNTATYCAKEGGYCSCTGAVYFGQFQSKLKSQAMKDSKYKKWASTGSTTSCNNAHGDPAPNFYKFCYCTDEWTDRVTSASSTCAAHTSTGSKWSYYIYDLAGNTLSCPDGQYMREFSMNANKHATKNLIFDYTCCNYTVSTPVPKPRCKTMVTAPLQRYSTHLFDMPHLWVKCAPGTALKRFQFLTTSNIPQIEYTCCEPPAGRTYATCADILTPRKAQQLDVRLLPQVMTPAKCPVGEALTGWSLAHDTSAKEMWSRTTCCQIVEKVVDIDRRTCSFQGFPHIMTFDGKYTTAETPGSDGYVTWLMRSARYHVQLKVSKVGSLNYVTAVAISGSALQGHKLVVKKTGSANSVTWDKTAISSYLQVEDIGIITITTGTQTCSWTENTNKYSAGYAKDSTSYSTLEAAKVACVALGTICKGVTCKEGGATCTLRAATSLKTSPSKEVTYVPSTGCMQTATSTGASMEVEMLWAGDVEMRLFLWETNIDGEITMNSAPGSQTGHCGNNNGEAGDDGTGEYTVTTAENIFGGSVGSSTPTSNDLASCPQATLKKAEAHCGQKYLQGSERQEFIDMCITDYCFDKVNGETAADYHDELTFMEDRRLEVPRRYLLIDGSYVYSGAKDACPSGMSIAMIRSAGEQNAAWQTILASGTDAENVWLGGHYTSALKWSWEDGDQIDLTGVYSNWDAKSKTLSGNICMSVSTGQWLPCKDSTQAPVLCSDTTAFELAADTYPHQMKDECGRHSIPAMPKSLVLQTAANTAMLAQTGYVWLGARYISIKGTSASSFWQWLDGTSMGSYTNWDTSQPDLGLADFDQLYLCAKAETGKWHVCPSGWSTYPVLCMSSFAQQCTPGTLDYIHDIKLHTAPIKTSVSFDGFCYYMSKPNEDCQETCAEQIAGVCEPSGLTASTRSLSACKSVVGGFHLSVPSGSSHQYQWTSGDRSCDYVEQSDTSKRVILSTGTEESTCASQPADQYSHKMCACSDATNAGYPTSHKMQEGDDVHVEGTGFGTDMLRIRLSQSKAANADCNTPTIVDPATRTFSTSAVTTASRSRLSGVAWEPTKIDEDQWIEMDLESETLVKGIVTVGMGTGFSQTSEFKVSYTLDKEYWHPIEEVFEYSEETDQSFLDFETPVLARYVRFIPTQWQGTIQAKVGIRKCTETLLYELRADPTKEEMGWCENNECHMMALWPFGSSSQAWIVDIKSSMDDDGKDLWVVQVNGEALEPLTLPKEVTSGGSDESLIQTKKHQDRLLASSSSSGEPNLASVSGATGTKLVLEKLDTTLSSVELSMSSDNGILEHDYYTFNEGVLAINFLMKMTTGGSAIRCIRCESEPTTLATGNHILEQNSKLTVDLDDHTPRAQTFATTFEVSQKYNISIVYVKEESTLELYVDGQLKESLSYTKVKSTGVSLRPGHLGGFHQNSNLFSGLIEAFTVTLATPKIRPRGQSCSKFACPDNYILKAVPGAIFCQGEVCSAKDDRDTCCDAIGYCSQLRCPLSMVHKSDAATSRCLDYRCEKTHFDICCEAKGLCSQAKCGTDTSLIDNATKTVCITKNCNTAADLKVCCRPQGKCTSLSCPSGYIHRENASTTPCNSHTCTLEKDQDLCCAKGNTCEVFKCPTNMTLKANAKSITCSDQDCLLTSYGTCCADAGSCSTLSCPDGSVLKQEASSLRCSSLTCQAAKDAAQCCTTPEKCTGMQCAADTVHRGSADKLYCKGLRCTSADQAKCCTTPGYCSSYTCPDQYEHVGNAAKKLCLDRDCKEQSFDRCCAKQGYCSTLTCKPGYVLRPMAEEMFCKHSKCKVANDNDRCCVPKAPCSQMTCNSGYVPRANASSLTCANVTCTATDNDVCCAQPGRCSSFQCPSGYSQRHDAARLPCADAECLHTRIDTCCVTEGVCSSLKCGKGYVHKSHADLLQCHNHTCTLSKDRETCCAKVASCNEYVCPAPYVLKGNAASLPCASSNCTSKDTQTCCDQEGLCSTFQCPPRFRHKPEAGKIYCKDKNCSNTSYTHCCVEEARCGSYTCPKGYFANPAANYSHCEGFTCTVKDRDKCCLPAAKCSSLTCPKHFVPKNNGSLIDCGGPSCHAVRDKHACCSEEGKCTMYQCPDKYVQKPNAKDIFCHDAACNSTSFEKCCAEEGRCSSLKCPDGMVLRDDANLLACNGTSCSIPKDTAACCIDAVSCNSNACLTSQVLRADFKGHMCKEDECTTAGDNMECCSNKGYCLSFLCPEGFDHKHNASHIQCDDDNCTETPFSKCCDEEGTCNTYTCPDGFVRRPGAAKTHCETSECGLIDATTCCMETANCGGYECPYGMTLRGHPTKISCSGSKCTSKDATTCCAPEGRCDTMTCPENYQHLASASKTYCDDKYCNNTDFHKCCGEDGHCSLMTCPSGYIHRVNLTGIHCEGWSCTEADRDVCCDRTAACADEQCPFEKVLKSNATTQFCQGATCELDAQTGLECHTHSADKKQCVNASCYWLHQTEMVEGEPRCAAPDVATCCTKAGTCSSLSCPNDYLLRANASKIYCSDMSCDATDYESCCVEHNHCLGYKCPEWFTHKAAVDELFCKGSSCTDDDRDVCCDPVATCNTLKCAEGLIHRPHAEHLRCIGLNCTAKDMGTCCVMRGHCGIYDCPYGWINKRNAQDILCEDASCSNTDYHECCDAKAKCSTMDCGLGFFPRVASANAFCKGPTCQDVDTPTCCDKQANCGSYECPAPYKPKEKAHEVLCHGRTCNDGDLHTCCGIQGTCSAFTCPQGTHHRADARHTICPNRNCSQADPNSCCAPTGSCSTYHCPHGLVLNASPDELMCQGGHCTVDDEDTCCGAAATCNTMACPTGFVLRPMAEHLFCHAPNCTVEQDQKTCCAALGICTTHQCQHGTDHKFDAAQIKCPGGNCTSESNGLCCATEGTCATFNCPPIYVRKPNVSSFPCRNKGANVPPHMMCTDADVGGCCERKMPCSQFTCPVGKVLKQDFQMMFCDDKRCSEADQEHCCETQASCSTMACGSTKPRPGLNCSGPVCKAHDFDICCQQTCAAFECPKGFVNRTDKSTALCMGSHCDAAGDVSSCCLQQAPCSTYGPSCPDKLIKRGNETLCQTDICSSDDEAICCAASCKSFSCPDETHVPKDAGEGLCGGMACNETDQAVCCEPRASCSGLVCPSDVVNLGEGGKCISSKCGADDVATCCVSTCSAAKCIDGYVEKADSDRLLCKTKGCTTTEDTLTCCDPAASCTEVDCASSGLANRGSGFNCALGNCTADDKAKCCLAYCSSYTCPAPYIMKEHVSQVTCKGHECDHDHDKKTCCEKRALCSTYECAEGLVMVESDQYCAGAVCRVSDAAICCRTPTVHTNGEATFQFVKQSESGKCLGAANEEPASHYYTKSELTQLAKTCAEVCAGNATCSGYSLNTEKNCYIWLENGLHGGGESWHGAHCWIKTPIVEPGAPSPQPCESSQKSVVTMKSIHVASSPTTTTSVPTDIIPQQQLNKNKQNNTMLFFIVICVILLGGALLALIAVAMFSRRPSTSASAAPTNSARSALLEDPNTV